MDPALKRLTKRMPPPPDPCGRDVNWRRLEAGVGLTYPGSFKEFVGVYGGCVWFDNLSPFYSEARTAAEVQAFLRSVKKKLKWLQGNVYDEQFVKIETPLYPAEGGLFPFMIDYSSSMYCWRTERKDPDKWPVVCWFRGPIRVLEKMTIARMILEWLERKPRMVAVWGDVSDLAPERMRLD